MKLVIVEVVLAIGDVAVLEDSDETEVGVDGRALKNSVTLEGSAEIVMMPLVLL